MKILFFCVDDKLSLLKELGEYNRDKLNLHKMLENAPIKLNILGLWYAKLVYLLLNGPNPFVCRIISYIPLSNVEIINEFRCSIILK